MNIKTKYNTGNVVWVIWENRPVPCKIYDIQTSTYTGNAHSTSSISDYDFEPFRQSLRICYLLAHIRFDKDRNNKEYYWNITENNTPVRFAETVLYPSKTALLKAL